MSRDSVAGGAAAWMFSGATLLGAFLLFQIQPLIGKFILPWFGGAPAVWTACMLFFQVVLFGGYAYSHLVVVRMSPRVQALAQIVLLAAACAALPIAPSDAWKPADSAAPTARILLLLAATVGLPYFVLSTTSPLIQAWFSRRLPGRSPYRLYALSNVGSLAALLSYPFVFEPAFDVRTQARLWSWCLPAYAILTAACAVAAWRSGSLGRALGINPEAPRRDESRPANAGRSPNAADSPTTAAPTWLHRLLWLLLPACASLVLLATTNHVCQDVSPRPFLWVMPLSLYLLTFIICFDSPRWYVRPFWAAATLVGIVVVIGGDPILDWVGERIHRSDFSLTFIQELVLQFGVMFCICMVCHGETVRLKPDPRHLTEFYLLLSAGGALGGVFVGLVAPQIFSSYREWDLGLFASYLVTAVALIFSIYPRPPRTIALVRGAAPGYAMQRDATGWTRMAALFGAGALAGGFVALALWQFEQTKSSVIERRRNFYGVISVTEENSDDPRQHRMCMRHGAILHGMQFTAPEKRAMPLTYYTPDSGVGLALTELQKRKPQLRVGLVGLGVGTLASYARPGDHFTFYEINPVVPEIADKYFSYLRDARERGATIDIVMGDARLALERQPPRHFDLLVLDAFSGDSVPVHLLTREAMAIYRRHVADDGVIAYHTTNSYLYLTPVVKAVAEAEGDLAWRRVYRPKPKNDRGLHYRCDWLIVSGNRSLLAAIPNVPPPPAELGPEPTVRAWTDYDNNQFSILRSGR